MKFASLLKCLSCHENLYNHCVTNWSNSQIARVCILVLDRTLVLGARLAGYHSDKWLPTCLQTSSDSSKCFNYVDCLRRPLVPGCLLLCTGPPLWAGDSFSVAVAMEFLPLLVLQDKVQELSTHNAAIENDDITLPMSVYLL